MDIETTTKKKPWIIKWAFVGAIVIVLNLFFAFAIKVVYDEPEYNQFCEEKQVRIIPETKDECLAVGGQWTDDTYIQKTAPRGELVRLPLIETEREGYCDPDYTCRQGFTDASDVYGRNVFVALVVLGVLLIIGSLFINGIEVLSLGLSFGGILSLIIGTIRYWSAMDEYLRVVILGVALVALIWIAIKKFKD